MRKIQSFSFGKSRAFLKADLFELLNLITLGKLACGHSHGIINPIKFHITDQSGHLADSHFALWTMGFGGAEVTSLTLT